MDRAAANNAIKAVVPDPVLNQEQEVVYPNGDKAIFIAKFPGTQQPWVKKGGAFCAANDPACEGGAGVYSY